jgi:hypothetical protein
MRKNTAVFFLGVAVVELFNAGFHSREQGRVFRQAFPGCVFKIRHQAKMQVWVAVGQVQDFPDFRASR